MRTAIYDKNGLRFIGQGSIEKVVADYLGEHPWIIRPKVRREIVAILPYGDYDASLV